MTQRQAILDFLKKGHHLTGLEALRYFSTMKLASRISEIKREIVNENFVIKDKMIVTPSGKSVKEYWIEQKPLVVEKSGQMVFI